MSERSRRAQVIEHIADDLIMSRATFNLEAEEIGPDVMAEVYRLESKLIEGGWDVEIHIDEESLMRENGIIDCVWMQATKDFLSLSTIRNALLVDAQVLSGWVEFEGHEQLIIGGMMMPVNESD